MPLAGGLGRRGLCDLSEHSINTLLSISVLIQAAFLAFDKENVVCGCAFTLKILGDFFGMGLSLIFVLDVLLLLVHVSKYLSVELIVVKFYVVKSALFDLPHFLEMIRSNDP